MNNIDNPNEYIYLASYPIKECQVYYWKGTFYLIPKDERTKQPAAR